MRGKITELYLYGVKNKYGLITGMDGVVYYFNQNNLVGKTQIDNLFENDFVTFTVEKSQSKYDIANHVILAEETGFGKQIKFFEPGISKRLGSDDFKKYLKAGTGEEKVIDKLSKVLAIHRVGNHIMDQASQYQFVLAGTTEIFRRFFNENGEFLVVFSYYENAMWQQKTLNVHREIRKRREILERRPLVNFYILISNAKDLIEKINAVKGEAHAAIIPFSFEEILTCEGKSNLEELMFNRFGEYYFENNMLGENDAIDDDNLLFGDRGKIADLIVARCHQGSNSGIFGLRRSGKTSVLNAVLRRLDWENTPYIRIECRHYETYGSWRSVLYEIAWRIRERVLGLEREDGESIGKYMLRLKLNSTEEDYEKRGASCFVDDVKNYCRDIPLFVLALDEVETIIYNTATSIAWSNLDSYKGFWTALRSCNCPLVVCGVNSTINEISNLTFKETQCDNPMYGRITTCAESVNTYLPTFTDSQAKTMMNTLGQYSNIAFTNVYSQINTAFGGQPWAIRQYCSFVFENVRSKRNNLRVYEVSKATNDHLMRAFKRSATGINLCETILQHLSIYREEYSLLKKLALDPDAHSTIPNTDMAQIDHLQKYGLIEYDVDTEYVVFRIGIIKDYICNTEIKEPVSMNNTERRHYIQDRVALCEKKLKTYVRNMYLLGVGQAAGINVLRRYPKIRAHRGIDVNSCAFADYFDHQKFDFYFSTLKTLISDEWQVLGRNLEQCGISRESFVSCMDDLNAGRTDADHYDAEDFSAPDEWEISDSTLLAFQVAFDKINRFFDQFVP